MTILAIKSRWQAPTCKLLFALAAAFATHAVSAQTVGKPASMETAMKIRIIVEDTNKVLPATLENNDASRDFAALLPLSLTLCDYNGTEKIADLPVRLSTDGAPDGTDPAIGDITYYAPWGNLAIFYRDFPYSRGLIHLGRIEGDIQHLTDGGKVQVRIERASGSD